MKALFCDVELPAGIIAASVVANRATCEGGTSFSQRRSCPQVHERFLLACCHVCPPSLFLVYLARGLRVLRVVWVGRIRQMGGRCLSALSLVAFETNTDCLHQHGNIAATKLS